MPVTVKNLTDQHLVIPLVSRVLHPHEEYLFEYEEYDKFYNNETIRHLIDIGKIELENSELDSILDVIRRQVTTEDLNIWVDSSGSDEASGSAADPYATFTRAMDDVAYKIDHKVHIRIAAGTYTETLDNLTRSFGSNGHLAIEGIGTPTVYSGPHTISSWGQFAAGSGSHSFITITSTPWSADELWGKWVRVSAGTGAGFIWPIYTNTNNTIVFHRIFTAGVGTATEIEIIDGPATTLQFEKGLAFSSLEESVLGGTSVATQLDGARLSVAGIKFQTDSPAWYPFTITGGGPWMVFTTFQNVHPSVSTSNWALLASNTKINYYSPSQSVFDNTLFDSWDFGGMVIQRGDSAWAGGYAAGMVIENGAALRTSCRTVALAKSGVEIKQCTLGYLRCSQSQVSSTYLLIDPVSMTFAISPVEGVLSDLGLESVYVENTGGGTDGLRFHQSRAYLTSVRGNATNIPGYGALVEGGSTVTWDGTTDITGVLGDTFFTQSQETNSWPAAGYSVTDRQGAQIIGINSTGILHYDSGLYLKETIADVTVYVATTGTDSPINGSISSPYKTITYALQRHAPLFINHAVKIKVSPGNYTDFPTHMVHSFGTDGYISIEATGGMSYVAGPFTSTGPTERNGCYQINFSGTGWSDDQWYGKFVRITSGWAAGYSAPIFRNGAEDIITSTNLETGVSGGTQVEIIEPATTITINQGCAFIDYTNQLVCPEVAGRWATAQRISIAGFTFNMTNANLGYQLEFIGGNFGMPYCTIKVPYTDGNDVNAMFIHDGGGVNKGTSPDPTGYFDEPFYRDIYQQITQCQIGSTPPTYNAYMAGIILDGVNARVNGVCLRSAIRGQGRSSFVGVSQTSGLLGYGLYMSVATTLADSRPRTYRTVRIWKTGIMRVEACTFGTANSEFLEILDASTIDLTNVDQIGTTPDYAVLVYQLARLTTSGTISITGNTADIKWGSGGTDNWPAANNAVTDAKGSWVSKR